MSQSEQCGKNKTFFWVSFFQFHCKRFFLEEDCLERVELELKRTFDWIIGPPKKSFNSNDGEKLEQKYFTIEPSKKYILVLSTHFLSYSSSKPPTRTRTHENTQRHACYLSHIHANATDTVTRTMQTHNHKITLARIRGTIASFNTHPVFASKVVLLEGNFFLLLLFRC